ncbi:MAG: DnaB-like helicase C-terminal domain-containing protein [Desulfocapsaceae bacterium]|nr:DnaB-like helicase C-terminal domain-containing protein [Desulfocapsaceae bacterium]
MKSQIEQFYRECLSDSKVQDNVLSASCPFCGDVESGNGSRIVVFLNPASFFYGFFKCRDHCVEGGFPQWFARLNGIDPASVPGPLEDESIWNNLSYPDKKINGEVDDFENKLGQADLSFFTEAGVGKATLERLKVGYNGRYLVYPYYQLDGNVYSARCVHPDNFQDWFWHGDVSFGPGYTGLFNVEEIQRCSGGTLFLCEGEENLLPVKQLGFPGVGFADRAVLERLQPEFFGAVKTLFFVLRNTPESYSAARFAASKIGYKVRILYWQPEHPRDFTLIDFAKEKGDKLAQSFGEMIVTAKPFSPFNTVEKEGREFFETIEKKAGEEYGSLLSGFPLLDQRIGGIHGINILGGGPKVGKSCFMVQVATELARKKIPVLYYDFENGRQRLYQRTFSRLTKIETSRLAGTELSEEEKKLFNQARQVFETMLRYFRVINDRKVSPELMRRHIDFLRHETRNEFTVVVIDSLHKLPFKDLREMRTGIDAWLRQMEAIRDELQVSFLVVSELSRGTEGKYDEEPHMGIFKGSGDIEYSADNAMVLLPDWDHMQEQLRERVNKLWLVGSRENPPGLVGEYVLDYPYWGFHERAAGKT